MAQTRRPSRPSTAKPSSSPACKTGPGSSVPAGPTGATTVSRRIEASPDKVFAQLADGWIYAAWVVGASHIRDVDSGWPALGTRIHHQVGPWPATIDDTTEVVEVRAGSRLVLQARAWPAGEARVELTIEPDGDGSTVTMSEAPTHGIGTWLDNPLQRYVLRRRNVESLARLGSLAENRPAPRVVDR